MASKIKTAKFETDVVRLRSESRWNKVIDFVGQNGQKDTYLGKFSIVIHAFSLVYMGDNSGFTLFIYVNSDWASVEFK